MEQDSPQNTGEINKPTIQEPKNKVGGLIGGIIVILVIIVAFWAYAKDNNNSTSVKNIEDVAEASTKINSGEFNGYLELNIKSPENTTQTSETNKGNLFSNLLASTTGTSSNNNAKIRADFHVINDATDKDNPKGIFDIDLMLVGDLDGISFSEPAKLSISLISMGDIVYAKLNELTGTNPLGFNLSESKWIKIDANEISELYGLPPADKLQDEKINDEVKKISEKYLEKMLPIYKNSNAFIVKNISAGKKIDGEETTKIDLGINPKEYADLTEKIIPIALDYLKEVLSQIPEYADSGMTEGLDASNFKMTAQEKKEFEDFLDKSLIEISVSTGNDTANPYEGYIRIKGDDGSGETEIIISMSGKNYNKSFNIQAPSSSISIREYFQGLQGN